MKHFWALLLLACTACGQTTIGANNGLPSPQSVVVTLTPTSIPVGGTSALSAQIQMSDTSSNARNDSRCVWSSSNTGVASISGNYALPTATGVSAGTASITCTDGNISGSATLTVTTAPAITAPNPINCSNPCPLTQGTQSTAYSFKLAATGGTAPYTWNISVGSLPTGLSLSSSGCGSNVNCNIQGTPSGIGTTNFTVRVLDAGSNSATLAVSLTVISNVCTPGPPTYPCTPSNVTTAQAPTAIPFSGLTSNGQITGTGGTGADSTLVSDPEPVASGNTSNLYHNPIIRLTNYWSDCGVVNEPACPVNTGGGLTNYLTDIGGSSANERWNIDDTCFNIAENTSSMFMMYCWTPGNAASIQLKWVAGQSIPSFPMQKHPAWSVADNHHFYELNVVGNNTGTIIQKFDNNVTYPTLPSAVNVVDLANQSGGHGCLQGDATIALADPIRIRGNGQDRYFQGVFSTSGTQNTGRFITWYDNTTGTCIVYNSGLDTNNLVTVTSNGTVTTSTVTCANCGAGITDPGTFTVHGSNFSGDGQTIEITAKCDSTSTCYYGSDEYAFQPLAGQIWVMCNTAIGVGTNCAGHAQAGYQYRINNNSVLAFATRLFPAGTASTINSPQPCTPQAPQDWHGSWEMAAIKQSNDQPDIGVYSPDTSTPDYTKCMVNEIIAMFPATTTTVAPGTFKRFAHSYVSLTACFGTRTGGTSVSSTGKYIMFNSNMNGNLGCMNGQASGCTQSTSGSCNGLMNRGDVFIAIPQ